MPVRADRPRLHHRAFVQLWIIVMMAMLIALLGIALDSGYTALVLNQMQAGADAAALAGAQRVKIDDVEARDIAVSIAAANSAAGSSIQLRRNDDNSAGGELVLGRYNHLTRVFTPNNATPNACKVVVNRNDAALGGPVAVFFGPLFGVDTISMTRSAIAMADGTTDAGLAILHPTRRGALTVGGGVVLTVEGSSIQVNSNDSSAVVFTGSAGAVAEELNVTGNVAQNGSFVFTGNINTGEPPIPDPLAWLPAPSYSTAGASTKKITVNSGETVTYDAHYYGGELAISGGTVNLNQGIHVFGNGLHVSGNGTLNANGAMIYLASGDLTVSSGSVINLTPPDPDVNSFVGVGTYDGIAIFQARTNTTNARLEDSNLSHYRGTLYFPNAPVDVHSSGNAYLARMVASTLNFSGSGNLTIDYRGRDPAAGNKPFLVK